MVKILEDKELLLRDLCARLPYGVVLDIDTTDWRAPQGHIKLKIEGIGILFRDMSLIVNGSYYGDKYKPYLRPMSSMTEEENKEAKENGCIIYWDTSPEDKGLLVFASSKGFDWLNRKMFDYRKDDEGKTLIEKGLALEAPKGMYNINEK